MADDVKIRVQALVDEFVREIRRAEDEGRAALAGIDAGADAVDLDQLTDEAKRARKAVDKVDDGDAFGVLRQQVETANQRVDKLEKELAAARKRLKQLGEEGESAGKKVGASFTSLKNILGGLGIGLLARRFGRLTKEAIQSSIALDRVRTGLEAAGEDFDLVRKAANDLGFDLTSTADAYTFFANSAKQAGLSADTTRSTFLGTLEALRALGRGSQDAAGILRAFGQIASKGRVQTEELNQAAERLPGVFASVAKALGLTEQALRKQLDLGNIYAKDLLPVLGKALREDFGEAALKAAADTTKLEAPIARVGNLITELKDVFVKQFAQDLGAALADTTEKAESFALAAENIGSSVASAIQATAFLTNALGDLGTALGERIGRVDSLSKSVDRLSKPLGVAAGSLADLADGFSRAIAEGDLHGATLRRLTRNADALIEVYRDAGDRIPQALINIREQLTRAGSDAERALDKVSDGAEEAASEVEGLSRAAEALQNTFADQEQTLASRVEAVRELYSTIGKSEGLAADGAIRLRKEAEAVAKVFEELGREIPQDLQSIIESLGGGELAGFLRKLSDEQETLRDRTRLVAQAFDHLSQSGDLSAGKARLLLAEVESLTRSSRQAGVEIPEAFDRIRRSLEHLAAQDVLQRIKDQEAKLGSETRALAEAFEQLSFSGQATETQLALMEQAGLSLESRWQSLGVEAPAALGAMLDAVGAPLKGVKDLAEGLGDLSGAARDAAKAAGTLAEEGFISDDALSRIKEAAEGVDTAAAKIAALQAKPVLSIDEANQLFDLQSRLAEGQEGVTSAIRDAESEVQSFAGAAGDGADALSDLGDAGELFVKSFSQVHPEFDRLNQSLRDRGGVLRGARDDFIAYGEEVQAFRGASDGVAESFRSQGIEIDRAGDAAEEFTDQQQRSIDVLDSAERSLESHATALVAEEKQYGKTGDAAEQFGDQAKTAAEKAKEAAEAQLKLTIQINEEQEKLQQGAATVYGAIRKEIQATIKECEALKACLADTRA